MGVFYGEVRDHVEVEVKRVHERLKVWNTCLAAHALAWRRGQLSRVAYEAEVERWRERVRGEVQSLHFKSAAAAGEGRLRHELSERVAARLDEPLRVIDELARAWLEKPPASAYPLMVVRGGASIESVLWSALETFDVTRNTPPRSPSVVWDESKHPRDADGQFAQTSSASRPSPVIVNAAKVGKRFANLDVLPEPSEHDPFEPIYESIPQAEARLRIVGVREAKLGSDLRVASATVRVIEETARLTGRVPERVVIDAAPFKGNGEERDDAHHVYEPITRTHTILVNPNAEIFSVQGKFATFYMERLWVNKWFSAKSPFHILRHEMGHMIHAEKSRMLFLKCQHQNFSPQARKELDGFWPSEYATKNPYEFVAEVYCMKVEGTNLHAVVQKWYKELGGWE